MFTHKGWLKVSTVLGHSAGQRISAAGYTTPPPCPHFKHQLRLEYFMWLIETMGICGKNDVYDTHTCMHMAVHNLVIKQVQSFPVLLVLLDFFSIFS